MNENPVMSIPKQAVYLFPKLQVHKAGLVENLRSGHNSSLCEIVTDRNFICSCYATLACISTLITIQDFSVR
jgi:hypothetical protein